MLECSVFRRISPGIETLFTTFSLECGGKDSSFGLLVGSPLSAPPDSARFP